MRFATIALVILLAMLRIMSSHLVNGGRLSDAVPDNADVAFTFHFKTDVNQTNSATKALCLEPHCKRKHARDQFRKYLPYAYALVLFVYIFLIIDLSISFLFIKGLPLIIPNTENEKTKSTLKGLSKSSSDQHILVQKEDLLIV